jgi:hypothetical protein
VGFACSHFNNLILFRTPRPIEARKDSNFFFSHIYLRSFSTTMHNDPDVLLFAPWIPSTFLEHPTSWPQRRVQGAYHSNKFEEDEASQGRIQFEGCIWPKVGTTRPFFKSTSRRYKVNAMTYIIRVGRCKLFFKDVGWKDVGEPTHTLVHSWVPKPLPPRNQCTSWFAPTSWKFMSFSGFRLLNLK